MLDGLKSVIIENRLNKQFKQLSKPDIEYVKKQIEKIKFKRLAVAKKHNFIKSIKHTALNSPYYRDKISEIVKDINYNNALSKLPQLPFTTSKEVSDNSEIFLAIPKEDVAGVHFTYGTTGGKKTIYNSKKDLNMINFSYTLGFINCGLTTKDVVQIMYSFGIWGIATYISNALSNIGILTLPIGNYCSFQEQQYYMEKFNTTTMFGTPSYVYNLSKEINLPEKNKEHMKAILVGGEGLPKHRREIIEQRLGGELFLNYGLNEFGGGIGSECKAHNGYHIFTNTYHEIIDPKTGDPVEKEEYGELVLTSISREAMPLIRYRTGDITREIEGECDCGLRLPRIDYLKGRADDRVIIGTAEKYYPIVFDKLLDPIKEIKDYWIDVIRENDKDSININVLTNKPSEDLRQTIIEKIYTNDSLRIDITTTKTVNEPNIIFQEEL
ncbi:MAG: phenylacetate--CoA ligase family protein, partial [Candidatus Thorarchaeota archaeon]